MFYSLSGKIQKKFSKSLVLQVGGIGFLVHAISPDLDKINIGGEVMVYTHFHVREDQMSLVGFLNEEYLSVFEKIISVSGIGIKAGISILSSITPQTVKDAVDQGKPEIFEKISGIGKKTAQKIVLELRGNIDFNRNEAEEEVPEAEEALISLGFTKKEAQEALRKIDPSITTVEEKVREVLKRK